MAATTPTTQAETSRRKPCGKGKSKVGTDYISVTAKRRVAFSKRKAGLMKKVRGGGACPFEVFSLMRP